MSNPNDSKPPTVSTADMTCAADYIDELAGIIREARSLGEPIDVEEMTMLILAGVCAANIDPNIIIAQQSLMLAICTQRLA